MIFELLTQIDNPIARNLSPKTSGQGIQLFGSLIQKIVGVLFFIGALFFFFQFLLGAIKWITSGGDKTQVEAARNQISHAAIGLLVLFAIFVIVKIIETVFSVCILFIDLGPLKVGSTDVSNVICGLHGGSGLPPRSGPLLPPGVQP